MVLRLLISLFAGKYDGATFMVHESHVQERHKPSSTENSLHYARGLCSLCEPVILKAREPTNREVDEPTNGEIVKSFYREAREPAHKKREFSACKACNSEFVSSKTASASLRGRGNRRGRNGRGS